MNNLELRAQNLELFWAQAFLVLRSNFQVQIL